MSRAPEPESESIEPPFTEPPSQEDLLEHRIGAALIDLVLLATLFAVLAATIGEGRVERYAFSFELNGAEAGLFLALVLLYYFALEATIAQTVGKLVLAVRVVRTDGSRPSVAAVAVRTLLRVVDWLPLFYLVGFVAILITDRPQQRLGDLAAKTSVARTVPVPHRGFATVAVAVVVLVLLGLSGYRAATVSDEGLSDLRVCADETYDEAEAQCTEDQREQPFRGRTVYCSAKVEGRGGEQFTGRFLYEGELFYTGSRTLPVGVNTVRVRYDTWGGLLPGGSWACELAVGSEKLKASFESAGPTESAVNLAACRTENTGPRIRVCRQDESDTPLGPTDSVTCSAIIFGGKGKVIRVDFLYEGRQTGLSSQGEMHAPIWDVWVPLTRRPNLLEGDYSCRFSLDGEQVGEKRFMITR